MAELNKVKIGNDVLDATSLHDTKKCSIQWYRGGYVTTTGKWAGNSLYSEESDATMLHPKPMQMLEGDVIPCPEGYTVSIAIYKSWHNIDDFEFDSIVARKSTSYTVPANKSGLFLMPVYKTNNGDVLCDKDYSFKAEGIELIRTITPLLSKASSYYGIAKRVNSLENQMNAILLLAQSLTGGVSEKFDRVSIVEYKKGNVDPDNAEMFGIWLLRSAYMEGMSGIPDNSGTAMLINISHKSYYAAVQFYILVSGNNAGHIYMRTKNKKSWSGVAWSAVKGDAE